MRLDLDSPVELTYCTNVHPGESWAEVEANLRRYLPAIKAKVAPDRPFGLGLRLSAEAAAALSQPPALEGLRALLTEGGLYVFTLNGFPYGRFHGEAVKEKVYLPDWREEARLAYTDQLAAILASLLPEGGEGSISTVPGAFKPRAASPEALVAIADNLVRQAVALAALEERSGRRLRLALEPEPCCLLETVEETIDFFQERLFSRRAAARAAELSGRSPMQAEALLRRHLGVCFDVCHAAVEFEGEDALDRLLGAGIAVPKIQLSAALRLPRVDARAVELLRPFDDGVYLHQVVERNGDGRLRRYADLDEAFAALADAGPAGEREWRVHFHVPVFRDDIGAFATTQDYLKAVLARQRREPVTRQLEVETYTWGVLPASERQGDPAAEIAREMQWVRRELAA